MAESLAIFVRRVVGEESVGANEEAKEVFDVYGEGMGESLRSLSHALKLRQPRDFWPWCRSADAGVARKSADTPARLSVPSGAHYIGSSPNPRSSCGKVIQY